MSQTSSDYNRNRSSIEDSPKSLSSTKSVLARYKANSEVSTQMSSKLSSVQQDDLSQFNIRVSDQISRFRQLNEGPVPAIASSNRNESSNTFPKKLTSEHLDNIFNPNVSARETMKSLSSIYANEEISTPQVKSKRSLSAEQIDSPPPPPPPSEAPPIYDSSRFMASVDPSHPYYKNYITYNDLLREREYILQLRRENEEIFNKSELALHAIQANHKLELKALINEFEDYKIEEMNELNNLR